MTSQVVFKLDTALKNKAMKKAQSEGIPFASILKLATKAYVDGSLSVDLAAPRFNAKTRREIDQALKEIEEGRGLSPRFTNPKDLIAYLDNL